MILHRPRRAIPLGDLAGSGKRRQRGHTRLFLGQEFRPGLQRHVHRVHRHIAEEGMVAAGRDECRRLGRDRPRMMGVVWRPAAGVDVRQAIHVEAVRWDVLGRPQMPFAEDAGRIAGVVQEFRYCHLACGKSVEIVRRQEAAPPVAANKIRDLHAGRMPAGHERRPGGRADRTGRVAPREEHPGGGQPIDRRRAIERAAGAAQVVGPEIIGQKDNDVRTSLRRRRFGRRHSVTKAEERRHGHRTHGQTWRDPARRWMPIPSHATLPSRGYRSCLASPGWNEAARLWPRRNGPVTHSLERFRTGKVSPCSPHPPRLERTAGPTIVDGLFIRRRCCGDVGPLH